MTSNSHTFLCAAGPSLGLWRLSDGSDAQMKPTKTVSMPNGSEISDVAWSADRVFFAASTSAGIAFVFDEKSAAIVEEVSIHDAGVDYDNDELSSLFFCSRGRTLALGCRSGKIAIYDRKERKFVSNLQGHSCAILAISANSDSSRLCSLDDSGKLLVHSLSKGSRQDISLAGVLLIQAAFHPLSRSTLAACGDDGNVYIWDLNKTPVPIITLTGHSGPVQALSWCPTNKNYIVSVSLDKTVRLWSTSDRKALKQALPAIPTSVSVNEKYSIIVGFKEGIMAFDIRKGRLSDYPSRGVQRLAFMPVKMTLPHPTPSTPSISTLSQQPQTLEKDHTKDSKEIRTLSSSDEFKRHVDNPTVSRLLSTQYANGTPRRSGLEANYMDMFSPIGVSKPQLMDEALENHAEENPLRSSQSLDLLKHVETGPTPSDSVEDLRMAKDATPSPQLVPMTLPKSPPRHIHPTPTDQRVGFKSVEKSLNRHIESMKITVLKAVSTESELPKDDGDTYGGLVSHTLPPSTTLISTPVVSPRKIISPGTFEYSLLNSAMDDALSDFKESLRRDIREMHLEMVRQFWVQKEEIEGLLKKYCPSGIILQEVQQLREENQRLRMNY